MLKNKIFTELRKMGNNRDKLPIIATDLDGIIGDTDTTLRRAIKDYFNIKIEKKNVTSYFYENCLDISLDRFEKFWKWFVKKDYWERVNLLKNARFALKKISGKYQIYIFTSRPSTLNERTLFWLKKKKLFFLDRLYHIDVFGDSKLKGLDGAGISPVFYIEDRLDYALEVAKKHRVLLFDYPWNQSKKRLKKLYRVRDWTDSLKIIFK